MQGFLFEQEEKLNEGFKELYLEVSRAGRLSQFLHCHIRSYNQSTSNPISAILKALESLESIAEGICTISSEISSLKPLKIDFKRYRFLSNLKDSDIRIETSPKQIYSIFKDLEMAVFKMKYLINSLSGKTKSAWMISKEQQIAEHYVEMCMGISRLQVALKSEIDGI